MEVAAFLLVGFIIVSAITLAVISNLIFNRPAKKLSEEYPDYKENDDY